MKTLADIISFVRSQLDENTASFWTDAEITKYINQAKDDLYVAMSTTNMSWFTKTVSLSKAYDSIEVEMPSDFTRCLSLQCTNDQNSFVKFILTDPNSHQFKDFSIQQQNPAVFSNNVFSYFPYNFKVNSDKKVIMLLAPRYYAIQFDMTYMASDPDLVNPTDTFNMFSNFLGYIQDKTISYCLRKGPSGSFEKFETIAERKLKDILTSINRLDSQSSDFVDGFGE